MEHSASELPSSEQLWLWVEKHGKQTAIALGVAAAIGLIIYFVSWKRQQTQDAASAALSLVEANRIPGADLTEAYLKVAAQYPKEAAGQRAALLAAGSYYTHGKFPEAQSAFEKFAREYPGSSLAGEALLGVACALDAQGKADLAAQAYKNLIDRHPGENVVPQAKFSLARIYESQNKLEQAKTLLEDVERNNPYSSVGSEAGMRLEDLKQKHPDLFVTAAPTPGTSASAAAQVAGQLQALSQKQTGLTIVTSPASATAAANTPAPTAPAGTNTSPAATKK